jgi:hypothetical protein
MWQFVRGGLASGLDRLASALTDEAQQRANPNERAEAPGAAGGGTPSFTADEDTVQLSQLVVVVNEEQSVLSHVDDTEGSPFDDGVVQTFASEDPEDGVDVAGSELQRLLDDVVQTCEWKVFLAYFQEIAKVNGTMISRDSKSMSRKQFEALFPGQEYQIVPGRGFLYCKVNKKHGIVCEKNENAKVVGNRVSNCEWTIHFRIDMHQKVYVVIPEFTNLTHSHAVNRDATRASGRRLITYEKEMHADEIRCVLQYGPAMLGVTKTRDIMRLKYQDRDYCGSLLSRLLKKGYDDHYGTDPDAMAKFMKLGNSLREKNGIFEFELGTDCRITNMYVMKPSMKAYADLFGDFVINDGTHNTDSYGMILMLNTLVDSLGKSVMSCY